LQVNIFAAVVGLLPLVVTLFRVPLDITSRKAVPDVAVQTEDGRTLRFYSDLVQGRVVAINFVFTSCTTVCPLMGARFARLQQLLGDAPAVSLISVSIDPTNDTPRRLAAWRNRLGGRPGWTLVTGAKPDLDTLTRALGASSADPASHAPLILVIDDRHGTWRRLDGLTDSASVARILGDLAADNPP
jgi:protein SCO1/2